MLQVRDLRYTYPQGKTAAVRGLDFAVAPGEVFGFLGPSGAGKSTTQKILTGLLKGYAGSVCIFDRELKTWDSSYYERIGVGFELPNHYLKLTARENLDYFRSLYDRPTDEPQELLERVGLADDADTLVGNFSKGMRMRLNFVRAIMHRPDLLFLDEPTSGLDPVNAQGIKELIATKKAAGTTIFLTTHNMAVADELCDRVAFIIDGEIKALDTPKALKLRYGKRVVRVEHRVNGHLEGAEFGLDGLGRNTAFLDLLNNDAVQTIHTQETTLEKIFIELTGRGLE
jgi:fluoroquinolone transport system ATP-binding protein